MKIYNAKYDYNNDGLVDETDFEEFRKNPNVSRTDVVNFGETYLGADRNADVNEEIEEHPVRPAVLPLAAGTMQDHREMIPYESPGQEVRKESGIMQSSLFWPVVIIGGLFLLPKIIKRIRS